MTNSYFFELGRDFDCALAELAAVLPTSSHLRDWSGGVVVVDSNDPLDLQTLQQRLGGLIRAGVIHQTPASFSINDFEDYVSQDLEASSGRNFGISFSGTGWSSQKRNSLGITIKKRLKTSGQTRRFVKADKAIIQSVVVHDQLLADGGEFWLIFGASQVYFGKTTTVQNWRLWSHYDYDRPARDAKRGMLPPKLARMMINISQSSPDQPLLDPFCGVGTVLQEAALVGFTKLLGTDTDRQAIREAEKNLAWLTKEAGVKPTITLETSDIERLAKKRFMQPRAIVSEVDLGPSTMNRMQLHQRVDHFTVVQRKIATWLHHFYSLSPEVVVIAYPLLREPRLAIPIEQLAGHAGWELAPLVMESWLAHPVWRDSTTVLTYERPDQIIGRQIVRLHKKALTLDQGVAGLANRKD